MAKIAAPEIINNIKNLKGNSVSQQRIVQVFEDHFNLSFQIILSRNNTRPLPYIRQLLITFLKKKTHMSLKDVGRFIGNRDHSTVVHSMSVIQNLMDVYPDILNEVNEINKKLTT